MSGYLNLIYNTTIGSTQVEWTAGGLFRDKSRSNFYNNYQLRPADPFAEYGKDFTDYTQIRWTIQNPRGSVGSALTYDATEQIKAGFIQFKG